MDASDTLREPITLAPPEVEKTEEAKPEPRRFEFNWKAIVDSPAFVPGVAVAIGFFTAFWYLIAGLPTLWLGEDGYYSHGFLVPFISAYVIFRWWPDIKNIKVEPAYLAAIPLLGVLWVTRAATVNRIDSAASACLVGALLFGTAFVGGWRWMLKLSLPMIYLGFCLPVWNMAINFLTVPLQTKSTDIAFQMLKVAGLNPIRSSNFIMMDTYQMDVGIPCSGFKLVVALYAFTVFFVLIARLRWWANLVMLFLVPLPLALFINGLRIMLIGVVGANWGSDAGHQFHDYSGYITLIVCFFLLFKIARWLGWKD